MYEKVVYLAERRQAQEGPKEFAVVFRPDDGAVLYKIFGAGGREEDKAWLAQTFEAVADHLRSGPA